MMSTRGWPKSDVILKFRVGEKGREEFLGMKVGLPSVSYVIMFSFSVIWTLLAVQNFDEKLSLPLSSSPQRPFPEPTVAEPTSAIRMPRPPQRSCESLEEATSTNLSLASSYVDHAKSVAGKIWALTHAKVGTIPSPTCSLTTAWLINPCINASSWYDVHFTGLP